MAMSELFTAFRSPGHPSWHGEGRTGVVLDMSALITGLVFGSLLLGFLLVLPGIRRRRLASLCAVTLSLFLGWVLVVSTAYPAWHAGSVRLWTQIRSADPRPFDGTLHLGIGLARINVTLDGYVNGTDGSEPSVYHFNEQFFIDSVKGAANAQQQSLNLGLPYPFLSILEVSAQAKAGFIWGRSLRIAGRYAGIFLWLSVALWALLIITLTAIPLYFSRCLLLLGISCITSTGLYFFLAPGNIPLHFPTQHGAAMLDLFYGWNFWLVLVSGLICVMGGVGLRLMESKMGWSLVTFLQADFNEVSGSPYRAGMDTAAVETRKKPLAALDHSNPDPITPFQGRGRKRGEPVPPPVVPEPSPSWNLQPGRLGPMGVLESTRLGEVSEGSHHDGYLRVDTHDPPHRHHHSPPHLSSFRREDNTPVMVEEQALDSSYKIPSSMVDDTTQEEEAMNSKQPAPKFSYSNGIVPPSPLALEEETKNYYKYLLQHSPKDLEEAAKE